MFEARLITLTCLSSPLYALTHSPSQQVVDGTFANDMAARCRCQIASRRLSTLSRRCSLSALLVASFMPAKVHTLGILAARPPAPDILKAREATRTAHRFSNAGTLGELLVRDAGAPRKAPRLTQIASASPALMGKTRLLLLELHVSTMTPTPEQFVRFFDFLMSERLQAVVRAQQPRAHARPEGRRLPESRCRRTSAVMRLRSCAADCDNCGLSEHQQRNTVERVGNVNICSNYFTRVTAET